ncbi:MAG TPA: hypothetical protein DCS93_05110 [Microscillaceae bacterium]|nr:hypothetical protein [Microscillaceae bacterium]
MQTKKIGRSRMKTKKIKLLRWASLWLLLSLALLPQITLAQQSSPYIDGLTSVCDEETVQYSVVFLSGSVTWEVVGGGGYVKTASGLDAEIVWTAPGTRTLRATITPEFGSARVETTTVTVKALPSVVVSGPTMIRAGTAASLTATGAGSYAWSYRLTSSSGAYTPISDPTTLTLHENTTFKVVGTTNSCPGEEVYHTVQVVKTPTVASTWGSAWAVGATFGTSFQVTGTPGANGTTCRWYSSASEGEPLATSNNPILNLAALNLNTFYVASYNASQEVESARVPFKILRLELATNNNSTSCNGTNTVVAAVNGWPSAYAIEEITTSLPTGEHYLQYHWYSDAAGTNLLQTGSTATLGAQYAGTNVYARVTLNGGILSDLKPEALPSATNPIRPIFVGMQNCGATVTLSGAQSGETYRLVFEKEFNGNWTKIDSSESTNGVFNLPPSQHLLSFDARYRMYITNSNGCKGADKLVQGFEPNFPEYARAYAFPSQGICLGEKITASVGTGALDDTFNKFEWSVNGTYLGTTTYPTVTYDYTPTATGTYTFSVKVYHKTTDCAIKIFTAPSVQVNDAVPPAPAFTTESSTKCEGGKTLIRATGGSANTTYRWYKDNVRLTSQDAFLLVDNTLTPATYELSLINTGGCEGPRVTIPMAVNAALAKPTIDSVSIVPDAAGVRTIKVKGAQVGQKYVWSGLEGVSDSLTAGGTMTWNFNRTTVISVYIKYTDGSCESEKLYIPIRVIDPYAHIEEADLNLTGIQTIRKKYINEADVVNLSVIEQQTRWQRVYLDGLGRPVQTIDQEASPNKLDVVQAMGYDDIGRSPRNYLPYTSGVNLKGFKSGGITATKAFYAEGQSVTHATDPHPYALSEFESSPLNRSFVQYAPGAHWVGAKKAVTTCLYTNPDPNGANTAAQDKIRLLRVNNVLAQGDVAIDQETWVLDALETDENDQVKTTYEARQGIELRAGLTLSNTHPSVTLTVNPGDQNVPVVAGFYAQGELARTTITDEDGKVTEEFKNKSGQVILKRAKVDENTWAQTYYAYDDFGQLSYVLPPEAVKVLEAHHWDFANETVKTEVARLWYRYYYDGRKRLITKEVPGAGKVMMVYDRRDRLVLSQDANQRQSDEWSFTKYDELNRPVMTGIHTNAQTRAQLQTALDANFGTNGYQTHETMDTTTVGKANHLYTNQSFPDSDLNVHSVTYYDNYHWKNDTTARYNFDATGDLNNLVAEPLTLINTGQVTATKTKILGSDSTYLTTVSYYDCRGRVLQTVADNHLTSGSGESGKDRTMTQYAFDGLVKQSVVQHYNAANNSTHYVTQWSEYDHTGRVKASYQEIQDGGTFAYKDLTAAKATGSVEQISTLAYNELGQLITKELGETSNSVNPLQTLDFRYNIRGWMTHLNDANLSTQSQDNDLFGFELKYAQGAQNNYLNGNIGQMVWKSSLDNVQRQYDYTYDGLNRLKTAQYSSVTRPGENGRYDVGNLVYDLNGNIQSLSRQGLLTQDAQLNMSFGTMDSLQYSYRGNQLLGVKDLEAASATGVAGDFRDGHAHTTSDPDYHYDVNGNMNEDKNKEITTIRYNHLNLPTIISFSGDRSIEYTYDAAGIKLKKEVYENKVRVAWTNYVGSFVYERDNLQFIHTAEGRALAPGTVEGNQAFLYEYHYKDHLGNLRVAFREGQATTALATFETPQTDKDQGFEYDNDIVKAKPNGAGSASELGSDTKPLGAWKTIKVTKGDKVAVEVQAHIGGTPTQTSGNGLQFFVQTLANTYNNSQDGGINNPNTLLLGLGFSPDGQPSQTAGVPNAYLRYVLYDEAGQNVIKSEKVFVTLPVDPQDWETLSLDFDIPENGILQVYTANETADQNVWFDDLKVTFTPQLIVQENHYYPFGLELMGLNKLNHPEHRWKFQGQEEQKEFGLNWSSFKWRNADVAIGRFHSVDPLAEDYLYNSVYAFSENKVIGDIELEGLESTPGKHKDNSILGGVRTWWSNTKKAARKFIKDPVGTTKKAISNIDPIEIVKGPIGAMQKAAGGVQDLINGDFNAFGQKLAGNATEAAMSVAGVKAPKIKLGSASKKVIPKGPGAKGSKKVKRSGTSTKKKNGGGSTQQPKEHRTNKRKSNWNKHTNRRAGKQYGTNKNNNRGNKNKKYAKPTNPNKKK